MLTNRLPCNCSLTFSHREERGVWPQRSVLHKEHLPVTMVTVPDWAGRTLTPPHNSHLQNNGIMRKQISKTRIHYILWFIWEANAGAVSVSHTCLMSMLPSSEVEKIDSEGIFMFSRSAHQADRWLSIKTMHFLVFCIISVKIKRLSETPPRSFWKKTKTVVPLAASSFEPSAIILPLQFPALLVSNLRISSCCLCCHPPSLTNDTREIWRHGIMVTHLFNCLVTDSALLSTNLFLFFGNFIFVEMKMKT